MKHFYKILILIMVITSIFTLSGCDKIRLDIFNASEEETVKQTEPNQDNDQTSIDVQGKKDDIPVSDTAADTKNTESITPSQSNIQPVANTELMIYTVNVDVGEIEAVTALIPEGTDITPELIVTNVIESIADQSLMIEIESVITEGDTVIVNFQDNQSLLQDVGAGIEAAVLDAIAQSLIDNLANYSKVIYRVKGDAYISGHIELGINEVYLGEN